MKASPGFFRNVEDVDGSQNHCVCVFFILTTYASFVTLSICSIHVVPTFPRDIQSLTITYSMMNPGVFLKTCEEQELLQLT